LGLLEIEGDSIKRIKANDGLAGRKVKDLAIGPDGRLLVGTSGGLSIAADDGQWETYEGNIAGGDVEALAYDETTDLIWVGNYDGLTRIELDGENTTFTEAEGVEGAVRRIIPLGNGYVWVVTRAGVSEIAPGAHQAQLRDDLHTIAGEQIMAGAMVDDSEGWFLTQNNKLLHLRDGQLPRLYVWSDGRPVFIENSFADHFIARSTDGSLWFGASSVTSAITADQVAAMEDMSSINSDLVGGDGVDAFHFPRRA
ncbi:MAG: hypothetical protein ACOC9J_05355, partial [Persicimonas sp.]